MQKSNILCSFALVKPYVISCDMKKILLIISLLLLSATLQAQYSDLYYHRVGDTIEWRSEIGYYAWWDFEYYYANNLLLHFEPREGKYFARFPDISPLFTVMDSAVFVQRYYTPTPLKVVGLAGSFARSRSSEVSIRQNPFDYHRDTNGYKDYFVIYDALPDSFPLVGKTELNPYAPYRKLHLKHHLYCFDSVDSSHCCMYNPNETYLPIFEYYFDSAIVVEDSFYVGGTSFGAYKWTSDGDSGITTFYWHTEYDHSSDDPCAASYMHYYSYLEGQGGYCTVHPNMYKFKHDLTSRSPEYAHQNRTFSEMPWEWRNNDFHHFLIYPLIEVDTTVPPASACVPIENIQATVSGTSATVTWDGFPNYSSILLRYGKAHLPQSQWSEIDVTGNTLYTLTNLEPMSRYSVTLKAECDTSKKETPWSAPVTFYVADTSGGEGIGETPTLLSQLTFLQPNPAQDEVTVTSSFNLIAIDIWTADGVMVYHGNKSGHDTVLDVSYLRAGTYIVAIHTHNGTTHKKLQIVR